MGTLPQWILFNAFVIIAIAIDLGVFHRRPHAIRLREAAVWSLVWIAAAILFGFGVLHVYGNQPGLEYFTGYLVEKALSIDNLFVFVLIFRMLAVPEEFQHRVLAWGVLGALVMRGAMIAAGAALIARYSWVLWILGAFLLYAGVHMLFVEETGRHPERSAIMRFANRRLRVTQGLRGARFFVREDGQLRVTPLFVVLILVEITDVTFAVDSIPAIFGITRNAFIVYTSNVFAILGLRSLYFLLADVLDRLRYLDEGLALVLMFIGAKMLADPWLHVPTSVSLGVVAALLAVAIAVSVAWPGKSADKSNESQPPSSAAAPLSQHIVNLGSAERRTREAASRALYEVARARASLATRAWLNDPQLAALVGNTPSVTAGIAVQPERFAQIRAAHGMPALASVPPDQDAEEFELHGADGVALDILTTRDAAGSGAIARFLARAGEGLQQVEFACSNVPEATRILAEKFGVTAVYPQPRAGANGTLVNFFLVPAGESKILIELYESPSRKDQPR
jgi:tellurite resistance protein TerC